MTVKTNILLTTALSIILLSSSCVSKKKFVDLESQMSIKQTELIKANKELDDCIDKLSFEKSSKTVTKGELDAAKGEISIRQEQIVDLRGQIADLRSLSSQQLDRVEDLTVLSKSATDNIALTIKSLENKDKYITFLQNARSKVDSLNLALALNLKSELQQGIFDNDIQVSVDKTVVFVNLSDKMLYKSGSDKINENAKVVLGKIARIIQARPNYDVMIEGHTDSKTISNSRMSDNWDLSAMRATEVVRTLQKEYGVDPSRMIAAGRSQYVPIADNGSQEGMSKNRRTRIVIIPKLDEFYDLLNPNKIPK